MVRVDPVLRDFALLKSRDQNRGSNVCPLEISLLCSGEGGDWLILKINDVDEFHQRLGS